MRVFLSLTSILAMLLVASAPSKTSAIRRSSPMALLSPRDVILASTKSRKTDKKNDEEEKTKEEKSKSLWPFGRFKEPEPEEKKEEEDKPKEEKSGPFGIFRKRPADEKPKKEEDSKEKSGKRKEKASKSKKDPEESKPKDSDEKSDSSSEKPETDEKDKDGDEKDSVKKEQEDKEKNKDDKQKEDGNETTADDYVKRAMERQRQQQLAAARPYSMVYGQNPGSSPMQRGPPAMQKPVGQSELLLLSALSSLFVLATRLFIVNWLVSKVQFDWDLKRPIQHFMWECLNDKFVKDDNIWNSVKGRPPQSMPFSSRKWNKIVKKMGPVKEKGKKKKEEPRTPARTVVLIELDTSKNQDALFADFANMVSFLVGANERNKQFFGSEPEVILKIMSGGGEVTIFALAAAHVKRLRMSGFKVTACVDRIAASGGYMMASQANQILAAPFAMVGSIGVMLEGLNVFEALKNYGVKTISLKAGDMKNPISTFGEVNDKDIKMKQKDLEESHRDFIELCRSSRPDLDPEVCNGRVLSGEKALETGMVDRILTSEEYIYEKVLDGDLVMKIHLVSPYSEQIRFARILQVLPHFGHKLQSAISFLSGGRFSTFSALRSARHNVDTNTINNIVKGIALASMIQRAVKRSQLGGKKQW